MNQYPAKPLMDEMARYGRYGDSMLVHMNPVEVAGIASLTPGGLTKNPVTGQPKMPSLLRFGCRRDKHDAARLCGLCGESPPYRKRIWQGALAGIGGLAAGAREKQETCLEWALIL